MRLDLDIAPALLFAATSNPVHLPLELLLVFGVAKLLGELMERLGQPGIVGEILAGVVLGPSILGWVQPDQVLAALSELGVMFLLFVVGLEVKSSELLRVGGTAMLVATLGVVLPFGVGYAIMAAIHASWVEALFVGAAMVATSVGITAQVLAAKGLLQERASKVILAAAVIDDVLGLLVLAFVSSVAKGDVNVASLVTTFVMAAAFTVLIAKYGSHALGRVIPRVEQKLTSTEAQFNLALLLLFSLSVLAVWLGVAAIVGAFLAGMALSETVNRRVHDLAQGINELLVPFFLAGIGIHLNISVFGSAATLWLSVGVLIAAIVTKLIGCGVGAWRLGRADMLRVGVGMIPRGEVGMVVAQIGLGMGVITESVYAVVVFMTVATTLVAPPMLKFAYRKSPRGLPEEKFSLS
ncbi:MAG TPA: cation:proton antiporter [Bryobacteraceae bacterium]|nr:cation:proton antiporter [Bryobacteraceae bacterium]